MVETRKEELQEIRLHTQKVLIAHTNHPTGCLFCERRNKRSNLRECMRKMPATMGCKYCLKIKETKRKGAKIIVANPGQIMSKLAPSYGDISYERLEDDGLQWPYPNMEHPGTQYMHKDRFTRGKGKFNVVDYRSSMELPDEEYPVILTTGRVLCQYHTGTVTRKVGNLNILRGEELVEMNPQDAITLNVEDDELIEVASRRGRVRTKAKTTEKSPASVVFMTVHFSETPTNVLANPAVDPIAKIPKFRV